VDPQRRANCEADVQVTGEAGFAKIYLATERIQLNVIPDAPRLKLPADNQEGVDLNPTFTWDETGDADGGKLTYVHCLWKAGEPRSFRKCLDVPEGGAGGFPVKPSLLLWILILLLILALFLFFRFKRGRVIYGLLALVLLILMAWVLLSGRGAPTSRQARGLDPNTVYYWKVMVEDGQGGTAVSALRRFATRK
jgi:hypothetical protein